MAGTRLLALLAGLVLGVPAWAITWNTETPSGGTDISLTSTIFCGQTGGCGTTTAGLGGAIITMTAYSTQGTIAPAGTSPTDDTVGAWLAAQIARYAGGIGISNSPQTEGTASPQNAIDNRGLNDILVVDFGSTNWDVSSVSIGYACQINSLGSGCTGTTSVGPVNFDAWVGNTFNSTTITNGFTGNGAAATLPGFSALTFSPDSGGTGSRSEGTSATGRYLIITGSLAGSSDAFRVNGIAASQGGVSLLGQPLPVPLPGSAPLIVAALLALTWTFRRQLAKAR
ncbi:MAG TPA: hypothetical protein VKF40_05785 [Burkholderiales bacterium]|nr:hypothetical protein [Burkholderiales bacterium]